jgi:hypothetical protein
MEVVITPDTRREKKLIIIISAPHSIKLAGLIMVIILLCVHHPITVTIGIVNNKKGKPARASMVSVKSATKYLQAVTMTII